MANFNLRPAREMESRVIKDLVHLVGVLPMGIDWRRFVVAVNAQDEIIGIGQLKPHGREILELASIGVHPKYRSQGIARAIIEYLLKDSPRPLYLMCESPNGPLYEKFGFHAIQYDEMPRYFQRISKLAGLAKALSNADDRVLIMKLQ